MGTTPANTIPLMPKDGTLSLKDGTTPTALDLTIGYRLGPWVETGHTPGDQEAHVFQDTAGNVIGLRSKVKAVKFSFSLRVYCSEHHDTASELLHDFLEATAASPFATRVTTSTIGELITFTIVRSYTTPASDTTTITHTLCHVSSYDDGEDDAGNYIELSGECYGTTTVARA